MVKLNNPTIPPEYTDLRKKAVLDMTTLAGDIATRNVILESRANKEQRRAATKFPAVATAWQALAAAQQEEWNSAALLANGSGHGYDLFVADYLYREDTGRAPHDTPHALHQLFGLTIAGGDNPSRPYLLWKLPDLVGPFTFSVSVKLTATTSGDMRDAYLDLIGNWLNGSQSTYDIDRIYLPQVDTDWTRYTMQLTAPARAYMMVSCSLRPQALNAKMQIDNLLITDEIGEVMREDFFVPRYGTWTSARAAENHFEMKNSSPGDVFTHEYFDD